MGWRTNKVTNVITLCFFAFFYGVCFFSASNSLSTAYNPTSLTSLLCSFCFVAVVVCGVLLEKKGFETTLTILSLISATLVSIAFTTGYFVVLANLPKDQPGYVVNMIYAVLTLISAVLGVIAIVLAHLDSYGVIPNFKRRLHYITKGLATVTFVMNAVFAIIALIVFVAVKDWFMVVVLACLGLGSILGVILTWITKTDNYYIKTKNGITTHYRLLVDNLLQKEEITIQDLSAAQNLKKRGIMKSEQFELMRQKYMESR